MNLEESKRVQGRKALPCANEVNNDVGNSLFHVSGADRARCFISHKYLHLHTYACQASPLQITSKMQVLLGFQRQQGRRIRAAEASERAGKETVATPSSAVPTSPSPLPFQILLVISLI